MIIKIIDENRRSRVTPQFLEAEQDRTFRTLKDCNEANTEGLFCGGLAICYGVIIYGEKVTLAHVSSVDNEEFFSGMISEASNNGRAPYKIILARSYSGYDELRAIDISNGHDEFQKTGEEFFTLEDKSSIAFFEESFGVTPKLINTPHDFFTISMSRNINLFEHFHKGSISYEEVDMPENEPDLHQNGIANTSNSFFISPQPQEPVKHDDILHEVEESKKAMPG